MLGGRVLEQESLKLAGLDTVKGLFTVDVKVTWLLIELVIPFFIFDNLKVSWEFSEDVLVSVELAKFWAKSERLIPKVFILGSFVWLVLKILLVTMIYNSIRKFLIHSGPGTLNFRVVCSCSEAN